MTNFNIPQREIMMAAIRARNAKLAEQKLESGIVKQKEFAGIKLAAKNPEVAVTPEAENKAIVFHPQQQKAIDLAKEGKEFCLIGAAGTGKTTTIREVVNQAIIRICEEQNLERGKLKQELALVAFTRRAVRNIKKAVNEVGAGHLCQTAHAFLEYQPVIEDYQDENGMFKTRKIFRPTITADNPSTKTVLIIVDEASMLGYSTLYKELVEACPNANFIFVGDINQLPPVMGDAVLGYKLATLPIVELTEVYRQAMDSPIIWFQHNFTLKGQLVGDTTLEKLSKEATPDKGLEFKPFKQNGDHETLCAAVANYMMREHLAGNYNYREHVFLIPFNKKFGTLGINQNFADMLGQYEERTVYEIIASFESKYLAVGDYVMHEKEEYFIKSIQYNTQYMGKTPRDASVNLNRWGIYRGTGVTAFEQAAQIHENFDIDKFLLKTSGDSDDEESTKQAASHIVELQSHDGEKVVTLTAGSAIRNLEFAYCTTIHKSQGSEWSKVWLILHKDHAVMATRELLYTGMTRAKDKLTVLYSPATNIGARNSSINKALSRAAIKGIGWEAKVEAFKGKLEAGAAGWNEAAVRGLNESSEEPDSIDNFEDQEF